ncbi:MAG: diguanylate cyclase [Aeromonadaceae bacterium]|nr:diguanylate cyclase [Aeromonadaceae bacterium]MBP9568855.1 diguanylate cyclase [Aeromonadaceae bacterium]
MKTRFRSIRQKFLLLYLLFCGLGLLGGAGNYLFFIKPLIGELERHFIDIKAQRVAAVLQRELVNLQRISFDWASWSALYRHAQKPEPEFAAENFIPETLHGMELDLVLLYDREGRLINQVFSAAAEHSALPGYVHRNLPRRLVDLKRTLTKPMDPEHPDKGIIGLLSTPAGMLFLAMQPLRRSDLTGPSVGALIFGRLLTPVYQGYLEQQTALPFSLLPITSSAMPRLGYSLLDVELGVAPIGVASRNELLMDIQVNVLDINLQPTVRLQAAAPRELYGLSSHSLKYSFYFVLGIFVMILALLVIFVHYQVTQPLRRLSDYIVLVRNHADFVAEPRLARDEIGHLARAFTTLLDELILKQRELSRLSQEDGLTQVANRRCFDELWPSVVKGACSRGDPLSLIMIDIDYFKRYNDCYGHPQGDMVLKQVALCLRQLVSEQTDLVARYGGEEFVVYLQGCDLMHARQIAEAMCQQVRQMAIPHLGSSCESVVTISCGVSGCSVTNSTSPDCWIKQADLALYQAKAKGRNRVELHGGCDQ